jgi:hypothetical protein
MSYSSWYVVGLVGSRRITGHRCDRTRALGCAAARSRTWRTFLVSCGIHDCEPGLTATFAACPGRTLLGHKSAGPHVGRATVPKPGRGSATTRSQIWGRSNNLFPFPAHALLLSGRLHTSQARQPSRVCASHAQRCSFSGIVGVYRSLAIHTHAPLSLTLPFILLPKQPAQEQQEMDEGPHLSENENGCSMSSRSRKKRLRCNANITSRMLPPRLLWILCHVHSWDIAIRI